MSLATMRAKCFDAAMSIITEFSPELNSRIRYKHLFKKKINLDNPQTFIEKLVWLKHRKYANDPLVKQCADKYAVRRYIEDARLSEILVPLLGVYDSPSEIDFDALPEQFVLKWNYGSGFNIICPDKSRLDREETLKKLTKWGKAKPYRHAAELHYKDVVKKIICEQYLAPDHGTGSIPDYKVYCFNGKPEAILVINNRGQGRLKTEFFDADWVPLQNHKDNPAPEDPTEKPACLAQMLDAAARLSEPFPFVRCDFYVVGGKLYFGEMTFTPAGGLYTFYTKIHGKEMGELLKLE